MRRKLVAPGRMYAVKLEEGEEVLETLKELLEAQGVDAALIIGIGGLSEAVVGYYSPEERKYKVVNVKPREGMVIEVASMEGNAVTTENGVHVHLHTVLSLDPKTTIAGHLVKGVVKPHMEVFVIEALGKPGGVLEVFEHRRSLDVGYEEWRG